MAGTAVPLDWVRDPHRLPCPVQGPQLRHNSGLQQDQLQARLSEKRVPASIPPCSVPDHPGAPGAPASILCWLVRMGYPSPSWEMATVGPTRDGQELYPRPWLLRDWLCWGCAGEVEAVYLERDESFHCTRGPKAQLSGTTPAPPLTGARGTLLWLLFCRRLEKHCRGGGAGQGEREGTPGSLCPSVCHPSPGAVRATQLCPRPHVTQLPTGPGKLPGRAGEGRGAPDR